MNTPKIKKRGSLPNQKDALAVKRKKYIMDILDYFVFDFNKTQLTPFIQTFFFKIIKTTNTHNPHCHEKHTNTHTFTKTIKDLQTFSLLEVN